MSDHEAMRRRAESVARHPGHTSATAGEWLNEAKGLANDVLALLPAGDGGGVTPIEMETVPECDCLHTYRARDWPWSIHRPGCPRLAAIKKKYGVGGG